MQEIINKLDLSNFVMAFTTFLSRNKPIFIQGDIKLHYKYIQELSKYEFKPPPEVSNLDQNIIHLKKIGVLKLYEIYEFIKIINYFTYIKKILLQGDLATWLENIKIPQDILDLIKYFDEKGELKSDIDDEFLMIENAIIKNKKNLKESLRRILSSQKLAPYLVDTQIHYINSEEALLLRGGFNHVLRGTVIGRSSAGFFYIIPESIKKLKEKEAGYLSKKEEIKYKYEKKISLILSSYIKFLTFLNKEFDRFDHYQARVFFAKQKDYNFLLPNSKKEILIKDFKHPALKEPKAVSIEFRKKLLFITGVNAGGKTMLLKSILSVAFLSKYLLPMNINVYHSKIGSFKYIKAILDDPQNVKNDISTFAGRMTEFSKLFRLNGALIGVDEVELGTDSDEAAALFNVMLQELIKKDMRIIITTHHKRLASMMASFDEVELYAALYDEKHRIPTFEFLKGTIGKSYAFETALRYSIPVNIVQNAKKLYGKDQESLSDLIQKNIDLELDLKKKTYKLQEDLEEIKKEKQKIKDIKDKSQEKLENIINSYESKYRILMSEIKKVARENNTKEIHRTLNKITKIKKGIKVEKIPSNDSFKLGDFVKFGNQKGKIISLKKSEATLECSGMILRVPLSKLKHTTIILNKEKIKTSIKHQKPNSSSIKIDLHGMRAEEALEKLDKFLSDALITGYDEVLISHGIGTGKLAYAVKEFLKIHPKIKSFEDAPINLGGYGATLVRL